jgi:1,4-dihydroxy-6-naphthoate synthase
VSRPVLSLGHSPDPDDAFMWWPITGMVRPDGGVVSGPAIDTGRFEFRAVPADIETLNRRAIERGDLDITALSARAYADVAERYIVTACGASFGEGYGPKLVVREDSPLGEGWEQGRELPLVAIPGERTTAFLVLRLLVGRPVRFVEMRFSEVVGAIARGDVGAGLVIHEDQITYGGEGFRLLADLGEWWGRETGGLPLPLGLNAVHRSVEERFGPGSLRELSATLRRSIDLALAERERSIDYAMTFAEWNRRSAGRGPISRADVDAFVAKYVNRWTVDMGEAGRRSVEELLSRGAAAGLCPRVAGVEVV